LPKPALVTRGNDALVGELGPEHEDVAASRGSLASVLLDDKKPREALAEAEAALAIAEKAPLRDPVVLSAALPTIGQAKVALRRPAEAIAPLERALTLRLAAAAPADLGATRFALARALWESGGDRSRARALARAARDGYGARLETERAEADAWLRAR
jgi:hypothetical protein